MSHRDTFDVTRDVNAMTCRQIVSVVMKRTSVLINIRKMTVVSSTVHEIFNKHRLWVSQTQRECRCYKQSASSAGLIGICNGASDVKANLSHRTWTRYNNLARHEKIIFWSRIIMTLLRGFTVEMFIVVNFSVLNCIRIIFPHPKTKPPMCGTSLQMNTLSLVE